MATVITYVGHLPTSISALTLCDRTVPLVLKATDDEPIVFLRFVLFASCAHVLWPRAPSAAGGGGGGGAAVRRKCASAVRTAPSWGPRVVRDGQGAGNRSGGSVLF